MKKKVLPQNLQRIQPNFSKSLITNNSMSSFNNWEKAMAPHAISGLAGGSDSTESTCKAGDLASIPGSGRSSGWQKICHQMATHSSILAWKIPWMEEPQLNVSQKGITGSKTIQFWKSDTLKVNDQQVAEIKGRLRFDSTCIVSFSLVFQIYEK